MSRAEIPPATVRELEEFEEYHEIPEELRPELMLEDYLALPVTNRRLEVIDGVIVMSPSPTGWHQKLLIRFHRGIDDFVTPRGLGEVFVSPLDILIRKLPKLRVRQPDVAFFAALELAGLDLRRVNVWEVVPQIVVEITSPSDRAKKWAAKLADYASIRVPEVWRADPDAESIEVLALAEGRYTRAGLFGAGDAVRSIVLPGLELPVGPLFAAR